jgi:RHS repeat-associated protein
VPAGVTYNTGSECLWPTEQLPSGDEVEVAFFIPPPQAIDNEPEAHPIPFKSQQSGAQMWWHGFESQTPQVPEFIEVKHWDGTIARYLKKSGAEIRKINKTGDVLRKGDYWQLQWVRDPFDNITTYTYDAHLRLTKISYPDGVEEHWNWTPAWASDWGTNCKAIEISYTVNATTAVGAPWAMVFEGQYYAGKLKAIIHPEAPFVPEPGTGAVYDVAAQVNARLVTKYYYGDPGTPNANRVLKVAKYWLPHDSNGPQATGSWSHGEVEIEQVTYNVDGKVQTRLDTQMGLMTSFTYGVDPVTYPAVPSGVTLTTSRQTNADGSYVISEFDPATLRVYRTIANPGPAGRPRGPSPAGEGTYGIAGALDEPDARYTDYYFDASCTCQKPIRVEEYSKRGGTVEGLRVTRFAYDPLTKLVTSVWEPNPATNATTTEVVTETEYIFDTSTLWSPRWVSKVTSPAGLVSYSYPNPMARFSTSHGVMQGKVVRTVENVTRATGLGGAQAQANVVDSVVHNIPNNPAFPSGVTHSGHTSGYPRGQARVVVDGDGVEHRMTYNDRGHILGTITGDVSEIFVHDDWGRLTTVQTNTLSSAHSATWQIEQGFQLQTLRSHTTVGPTSETKYFFDRWGNPAVVLRKNVDFAGAPPSRHGVASSGRPWIRAEYIWHVGRLLEQRVDRRPLDEGDGDPFSLTNPLFLVTKYDYDISTSGVFRRVTASNGAVTEERYDGFGTPFRVSVSQNSTANAPKLEVSRIYNDVWMMPSVLVNGPAASAAERRVTTITRNAGGSVVEMVEPTAPAPFPGYSGLLGGSKHQFDIDSVGRTIERRVLEGATIRGRWRFQHDQLGRLIRSEADVFGGGSGTHESIVTYAVGKASQIQSLQGTDVAIANYYYDPMGRVASISNAVGSARYSYVPGTNLVSATTQVQTGAPSVTMQSEFGYDALGRSILVKQKAATGGPANDLEQSYLLSSLGMIERLTDPMGRIQKFAHDALGRRVEHVRLGTGSDFIRNWSVYGDAALSGGRTHVSQFDGLGHQTKTTFDWAGRTLAVQNPGSDMTKVPTPGQDDMSHAEVFAFDSLSQPIRRYDGDGGSTQLAYDGSGRLILRSLETSQENISWFNTGDVLYRDILGRIVGSQTLGSTNGGSANGTPMAHDFPLLGESTTVDSLGRVHQESYDYGFSSNTPTVASTFTGAERFRRGLNYADNLPGGSAATQPLAMQYTPDSSWRLTQIQWNRQAGTSGSSFQHLASYTWVGSMRQTRTMTFGGATANATGVETYTYDEFGRLTSISDMVTALVAPLPDPNPVETNRFEYLYDKASNLKQENYRKVDGAGDRFTYDAYHRLKQAHLGVSTLTTDPSEALDPNGYSALLPAKWINYELDAAQNRDGVTETTASGTEDFVYQLVIAGDANRYHYAHNTKPQYDKRGNLIYDGQFYYRYDFLNRLQEVWQVREEGASAMQMAPQSGDKYIVIEEQPALEASRQEVAEDVTNLIHRVPLEHKDPQFRARLRSTIPGGVIRTTQVESSGTSGGGMPCFRLPADLELVALYGYDAFNRRVIRVVVGEETYLSAYDGWREVEEYQLNSATGAAEPIKQYVHGDRLDEMLSYRRKNGTSWETYYLQHGGQDTASKLINEAGKVVEQYEYDPYGKATVFDGDGGLVGDGRRSAFGLAHLWKAVRSDDETGLLYMRNRFYDPVAGRFVSRDPLGEHLDVANFGNGYTYAGSMPGVRRDPMGLFGSADGGVEEDPEAWRRAQAAFRQRRWEDLKDAEKQRPMPWDGRTRHEMSCVMCHWDDRCLRGGLPLGDQVFGGPYYERASTGVVVIAGVGLVALTAGLALPPAAPAAAATPAAAAAPVAAGSSVAGPLSGMTIVGAESQWMALDLAWKASLAGAPAAAPAAMGGGGGGLLFLGGTAAIAGYAGSGSYSQPMPGHRTFVPGPHAAGCFLARGPTRGWRVAERARIDANGQASGCHTCGARVPGRNGTWVGDHQPPTALAPPGTPQYIYPQCHACSVEQGVFILQLIRTGVIR